MAQDAVRQGQDFVFAYHDDGQDLAGLYGAVTVTPPDGGDPVTIPACDIVQTPRDFIYAYDALGRRMDPRRFAGEGGTPLDPVAAQHAPKIPTYAQPPPAPRLRIAVAPTIAPVPEAPPPPPAENPMSEPAPPEPRSTLVGS
jgi:hypothetical protein